jgi:hypothetical protein
VDYLVGYGAAAMFNLDDDVPVGDVPSDHLVGTTQSTPATLPILAIQFWHRAPTRKSLFIRLLIYPTKVKTEQVRVHHIFRFSICLPRSDLAASELD